MQSMSAPPLTECEVCGGKLKRLIGSGAGIIFKGSGFYCTDYKKPTGSSSASNETSRAQAANESKPASENKTAGESKTASENKAGGDSQKAAPDKTRKNAV